MSFLPSLESCLAYSFRNPKLLNRALTHNSYNIDNNVNSCHFEFIGSSSLYTAILQQILLSSPANIRGWELVNLVEQVVSNSGIFSSAFPSLSLSEHWKIDASLQENPEEKHWLVYAIAGALLLDGGYQAVQKLSQLLLARIELPFETCTPIGLNLPWGSWNHRITINLNHLNFVFPRCFSSNVSSLLPWGLETHLKPGVYNQRSSQIFELGEATLRWKIDLMLIKGKMLEPIEKRQVNRQKITSSLGLDSRQDQAYASSFAGQDWRRQSLDHRVHSLKNLLGVVMISDGAAAALEFADLILNRPNKRESFRLSNSIVVSNHI